MLGINGITPPPSLVVCPSPWSCGSEASPSDFRNLDLRGGGTLKWINFLWIVPYQYIWYHFVRVGSFDPTYDLKNHVNNGFPKDSKSKYRNFRCNNHIKIIYTLIDIFQYLWVLLWADISILLVVVCILWMAICILCIVLCILWVEYKTHTTTNKIQTVTHSLKQTYFL